MGPDGDYQPMPPYGSGNQAPHLSSLYTTGLSEDEDKFDLRKILAVARRRLIIIAGVAIAVSSGVASKVLKQVPNYEGKFQLLVGPVSGEDQVDKLTQSLSQNAGIKVQGPDYETQIQVLWSPQVISPILKNIQARYPEIDYDTLRSKLAISRLAETKILEVRYQDSDPEKIQFILKELAEGYVKYSQVEQRNSVKQGLEFVNTQTKELQDRVKSLQQKIQELRENYRIVDPETQGTLLTNRISEVVQQRQEAQTQLDESKQLYVELQSQLGQLGVTPDQAIAATALSEGPRYQELLDKLTELDTKIATESARFTEENPIVQRLVEERERLLPLIEKEASTVIGNSTSGVPSDAPSLASPSSIRQDLTQKLVETTNQIELLEIRTREIAAAENLLNQQITNLPAIARRYTDYQRDLKVATESLGRFLAVRETLQIEESQKTPPWQKLSEPKQPEAPISPNVPRGLVLSAIAGLLAGAGAGLLAEKLDKVFHSPDELKDSTGLPVLGTIPFTKELKARRTKPGEATPDPIEFQGRSYGGYSASPLLEAFRSLNANLQFLSPDQPIRSLVLSSSVPADGKSTVATYLAQAAAAMGQRVLLVDADLRRPQVHVRTDLPNVWGLSNVISSEINVDDVIQRSPLEDNLFVLTAGQIPPDPTRLLCSKKMQNLVERFQEAFDLVIFDTPPLLGLADARLLAAHTDGIVMVVGLGRTDRAVLTQVLYGLRTSHARVLGLVANGVKGYTTSSPDYYHHYYAQSPQGEYTSARQ
ncbi:MAG: polysaccharide biosynthesis tyrosine autokinase [Symplocastrum torsivum CPER-KK1]|jgi:capsular exopolysaccharide synthesis family protein|uniref:non-specific protein-tyrosine kinase n=1 Tax=Symplocastrum torsivum CPER-KK1 TaxID=450513 RepID=A0A951PKP3_9CYAN|nr:polysaccharide biosynthesis tyrosine autokinase [Symplocastrum torsivum CPER-KK1]